MKHPVISARGRWESIGNNGKRHNGNGKHCKTTTSLTLTCLNDLGMFSGETEGNSQKELNLVCVVFP